MSRSQALCHCLAQTSTHVSNPWPTYPALRPADRPPCAPWRAACSLQSCKTSPSSLGRRSFHWNKLTSFAPYHKTCFVLFLILQDRFSIVWKGILNYYSEAKQPHLCHFLFSQGNFCCNFCNKDRNCVYFLIAEEPAFFFFTGKCSLCTLSSFYFVHWDLFLFPLTLPVEHYLFLRTSTALWVTYCYYYFKSLNRRSFKAFLEKIEFVQFYHTVVFFCRWLRFLYVCTCTWGNVIVITSVFLMVDWKGSVWQFVWRGGLSRALKLDLMTSYPPTPPTLPHTHEPRQTTSSGPDAPYQRTPNLILFT